MEWINPYGLVFVAAIMLPNIIFAIKHKDGFKNEYHNKIIEALEQIGRIGCIAFMTFNIPKAWFGWRSNEAFAVYLIANSAMVLLYFAFWIIFSRKKSIARALSLSITPSVIFLFSGVMSCSPLLIASSLLFAFSHIRISYKNAKLSS